MQERNDIQASAFDLKRTGEFEQALDAYAEEYSAAARNESSFIKELCFEQMFDVTLLMFLREIRGSQDAVGHTEADARVNLVGRHRGFPDRDMLLRAIAESIRAKLVSVGSYEADEFDKFFGTCWEKLPRDRRGKNPFSVDQGWLISG